MINELIKLSFPLLPKEGKLLEDNEVFYHDLIKTYQEFDVTTSLSF